MKDSDNHIMEQEFGETNGKNKEENIPTNQTLY